MIYLSNDCLILNNADLSRSALFATLPVRQYPEYKGSSSGVASAVV